MTQEQGKILHIDAVIELRDYFQAYFDTAKTKLIVACLICATVIALLTYFFILIGEQKILLELSPLFFGLPIVAVFGQFLRIHAAYRKYLAELSESEKSVHYLFQEHGDGFDVVRGKNFSHVAWESLREVIERPRYFRFVLNKYDYFIIPKRFLRTESQTALLEKIVITHLGDKAKVLGKRNSDLAIDEN